MSLPEPTEDSPVMDLAAEQRKFVGGSAVVVVIMTSVDAISTIFGDPKHRSISDSSLGQSWEVSCSRPSLFTIGASTI